MMECPKCNRISNENVYNPKFIHDCATIKKVVLYHDGYGCDSGCCGIRLTGYDEKGRSVLYEFSFFEPDSNEPKDIEAFAKNFVSEYVRPDSVEIDYDDCRSCW